jgi:hypothetical protein
MSHESKKDIVELLHLLCILSLICLELQTLWANTLQSAKQGLLNFNQTYHSMHRAELKHWLATNASSETSNELH